LLRGPEQFSTIRVHDIRSTHFINFKQSTVVSDIDTDELDSDHKNVKEEKVEFLVKEEVTVIE